MRRRVLPLALLLLLWGGTLWHLDRYPPVHEDEPWILSPGFKLARQGIFGSDLLAGFYRVEERYLAFQPLMSLLQAASVRALGVSVFAMRFLPAALGALTLALAYACARSAHGAATGALALLLLAGWQWSPPGSLPFASGVPLVDLSRIARYDLLVAPCGLGALWCWMRARRGSRHGMARTEVAVGALAGLAGMGHLYGLFFLAALALASVAVQGVRSGGVLLRMGAGALCAWLPWLAVIALHSGDYAAQNYQHAGRFALSDPAFYLANIMAEPSRYHTGFHEAATWARPGFWLLWLGVPVALLALARAAWRRRAPADVALCAAAAGLPLLYAALLSQKMYNYVAPLAPLFAWLVAWALARLWARRARWARVGVAVLLALVVLQGAEGWLRLHAAADAFPSSASFDAALRAALPREARLLGAPRFWLALTDYEYRSFVLPFMLSSPRFSRAPVPLERALEQIAPQVVLVDADMDALLADRSSPETIARAAEFNAYLQRHGARLSATLREASGAPVRLYTLEMR